jgi:hypothetical protein
MGSSFPWRKDCLTPSCNIRFGGLVASPLPPVPIFLFLGDFVRKRRCCCLEPSGDRARDHMPWILNCYLFLARSELPNDYSSSNPSHEVETLTEF